MWAFVEALDLAPLYGAIRAIEGHAGRPAIDPKILVALWLYATVDGVGSARELERLCERDAPYRWLAGGVRLNHHTLADFRTAHGDWLDRELTRSLAALLDRGLVSLEVVAQDGMRVRAAAKAASFRRRPRLEELLATARAQVAALEADPDASARRKQAAREARLAEALATLDEIERTQAPQRAAAQAGSDDKPPPADTNPAQETPKPQRRVSTTDPEARVMKMADGGFRPAFNAQFVVDTNTQLIAAIDQLAQAGTQPCPSPRAATPPAIRTSPRRAIRPPSPRGASAWPATRHARSTSCAPPVSSAPTPSSAAAASPSSPCAVSPRRAPSSSGTRSPTTSCAWPASQSCARLDRQAGAVPHNATSRPTTWLPGSPQTPQAAAGNRLAPAAPET